MNGIGRSPGRQPRGGPRGIAGLAAGLLEDPGGLCEGDEDAARPESLGLRKLSHHLHDGLQLVSSLIYLQTNDTQAPEERQALECAAARIRSVVVLCETLFQRPDPSGVAMDRYLDHLLSPVGHPVAARRPDIRLDVLVEPIVLDVDRAMACGLLANELLVHTLVHASPGVGGRILVRLDRHDPHVRLLVRDRGGGLPPGLTDKTSGLGPRLIRRLVTQLGGTLRVDRGHGTTSIRFAALPD